MSIASDIETGPLALEQLREVCPAFDPSTITHPGSFDPASVKVGNLKDQAKINEKIEQARAAHAQAVADFDQTLAAAEARHWAEIESKAALNAITGRILAIGYKSDKGCVIRHVDDHGGEPGLLTDFWRQYQQCRKSNRKIFGFNFHEFDVPFLVRRSWILGVEVPSTIYSNNRYVDSIIVDLMQLWKGPAYRDQYVSLDTACRACGLGAKLDGVSGGDFARLYFGTVEERQTSLDYLAIDLDLTHKLAVRMGVWV